VSKKKILFIADGVTHTGFSTVSHNIIKNLPKEKYDVHHLAVNYFGDPHDFDWKIYPAAIKGDLLGFNRIQEFANRDFNTIFILNDAWVINHYLTKIKETFNPLPKIVVYFPVDSKEFDEGWFKDYEMVTKTVVYTNFGYQVVKSCKPDLDIEIIGHGVDTTTFFRMDKPKREIKKLIYPNDEKFLDSFIVLNANRNQPRKRIELGLEGFSLFAKGKPDNVKYYHHAGLRDAGVDVLRLVKRYDFEERFIITNKTQGIQQVPPEKLNLIYNSTDVGLNCSLGEGWGLVNHEHAVTGAPQVVADHSALHEVYDDCGLLIPVSQWVTNHDTLTVAGLVRPEDIATKLNDLYYNQELYDSLSRRSLLKFTDEKYQWKNIAKQWENLFDSL